MSGQVLGLTKLLKRLESVPAKIAKKMFRKSLREGAKVIQKEVKRRAPRRTGALRRGITVRAGRRSRITASVNILTPSREKLGLPLEATGYYPAVIEYGAPRRGVPADPYIRPAFESKRDEAERVIAANLRQFIRSL
jgi:HK97 gp10 family phage protein